MQDEKITSQETPCYNCDKMGETQTISIPYSSMPTEIIHAFVCHHCNTRDVGFYDKDISTHRKSVITCNFKCKEDLQRYVYLQEGAKLVFYKGVHVFYKYEVPTSTVLVVEMLLTSVIRQLAEVGELDPTDQLILSEGEEGEGKGEGDENLVLRKINELKRIRDSGLFKLVIKDDSGRSRVGKLGQQSPDNLYSAKFSDLNDDVVHHTYAKKN